MAGGYGHLIDDETGEFNFDTIENMGDAWEACEECFYMVRSMANRLIELGEVECVPEDYHCYKWKDSGDSIRGRWRFGYPLNSRSNPNRPLG